MSEEIIKTVIVRAISDTEFRDLLFDDPDKALAEYELDEDEVAGLKGMQRDKFDANAGELEERISRAGINLAAGDGGIARDANHDKWIDVLSIDWGSNKPGG